MKRRGRHHPGHPPAGPSIDFVRGFLTTGLLTALEHQGKKGKKGVISRDVLRHALQGGTALAAGTAAVTALHHRNYGGALVAVAGGAAGLIAIEYVLRDKAGMNEKGKEHGQEEG